MSGDTQRKKQLLFVDDDRAFLDTVRQLFSEMSGGAWEIFTAENHAQGLAALQQQRMDVVVLDLNMPVMDGLQFLRLLARTHPGQQVVVWTGHGSEESRKSCAESGAALFLEKVPGREGFGAVFAALDALANAASHEGFRGVMRRVGLQEVLQMECLGRKSSVLEVFTGKVRGRIFISDGAIVHAESGALQGEVALYGLLGLRGGEFNLVPYTEPAQRTISGQYEFLLMEAARLNDEGTQFFTPDSLAAPPPKSADLEVAAAGMANLAPEPAPAVPAAPIEEIVLCSGAGEVLYEWQCKRLEQRTGLLGRVERQAAHLSTLLAVGRFDRLEILTARERIVCQVQPRMRLFVRRLLTPPAAS